MATRGVLCVVLLAVCCLVVDTSGQCFTEDKPGFALDNFDDPAFILDELTGLQTPEDCIQKCCERQQGGCTTMNYLARTDRDNENICVLLHCIPRSSCTWFKYPGGLVSEVSAQRPAQNGTETGTTGLTQQAPTGAGQLAPTQPGQQNSTAAALQGSTEPGKGGPTELGQTISTEQSLTEPGQQGQTDITSMGPTEAEQAGVTSLGQNGPTSPGQSGSISPGQNGPTEPGQQIGTETREGPEQGGPTQPGILNNTLGSVNSTSIPASVNPMGTTLTTIQGVNQSENYGNVSNTSNFTTDSTMGSDVTDISNRQTTEPDITDIRMSTAMSTDQIMHSTEYIEDNTEENTSPESSGEGIPMETSTENPVGSTTTYYEGYIFPSQSQIKNKISSTQSIVILVVFTVLVLVLIGSFMVAKLRPCQPKPSRVPGREQYRPLNETYIVHGQINDYDVFEDE